MRLHGLLTVNAHEKWERYLLERLNSAGKQVAEQQFQVFRSLRSAFFGTSSDQQSKSDAVYREFIGADPTKRLGKLLAEFPGLARICEILVGNWVSTVCEFLERLDRDLPKLSDHFPGGSFADPIDDLRVGLSDPHRGGRCVVRINFPACDSLIYKPRSLASENHFTFLLQELNAKGPPHDFRSARCWDQEDYGWMEDMATHPCSESADIHAFYWRLGALLALVYLSRGVDMHKGNLIANGAYPVLIDLETLWHPQEHIGAGDSPVANTALRTGFLPQIDPAAGLVYELNAISHRTAVGSEATHHLPVFAGTALPATDFLPDILAGYRWIGEQIFEDLQTGEEFRRWVQMLARCRRRRILRTTTWYHSVIERMIAPPFLRASEGYAVEHLNVGEDASPLTEDEWSSLLQMDVPYVEQSTDPEKVQNTTLPVQSIEAFLKQEPAIINAFTPAAHADGLHETAIL